MIITYGDLDSIPCLQSTEKGKAKPKGKGRKRKAPGTNEAEHDEESTPEPMQTPADEAAAQDSNDNSHGASTPPHPSLGSDITSSNAYMLLYKKRGWQSPHQEAMPAPALPDRSCFLFSAKLPLLWGVYISLRQTFQHEQWVTSLLCYTMPQRAMVTALPL